MTPKYFKTTFTYSVLSEDPLPDCLTLEQIHVLTHYEDCVGQFVSTTQEELTPKQTAEALYAFGSEPGFFQLNDDGTPIEET